ncbi:zinc-binding dehydrogenase [Phycicoccus sp. CSK15P-2]|uniref:zinc-binding dehydrogenase n=1 Tax=Phycicoccus sp. CSK15P-2 TaxID=2807627 RepID=UPI00194F0453|nr:zinc-binding dehydrogenase [Phycicoccus sp. CSK15P-2]MBM6402655.1 zinc-binding dehydrogenase [Phycicoccus sp. CSK15P-2]
MRASVLRNGSMVYRDDVPEPEPGPDQVLIEVDACGVCGGDLHFAQHSSTLVELAGQMSGAPSLTDGLDLGQDVFMGHEYTGEVVAAGPGTDAPAPGTIVTSMPALISDRGMEPRLYSNTLPGGYAEQMLLSAPLVLTVPNGLDPRLAALTEPMAVGLHAVNKADITPGTGAIVIGSGPAGLAVIAELAAAGVAPIVASDFSPARRQLAEAMGAHAVVDPATEEIFDVWRRTGSGVPVVFEAVGVPGMLDSILRQTPFSTRVIVVGGVMEPDQLRPYFGIAKEAEFRFVQAYTPDEFAETLRQIADGELNVAPWITAEVGLEDVGKAFEELGNPEKHCKILVRPNA